MLLRLSKNAFVRQYGQFTYILDRLTGTDKVFVDAEVFTRWITRTPIKKEVALEKICKVYSTTMPGMIATDFDEFLDLLIKANIVVAGETVEEIERHDNAFSYYSNNPRTSNIGLYREPEGSEIIGRTLKEYFRNNAAAFNLQIEITDYCTERCVHCYMANYNSVIMSYSTIERVISEFRQQGGIQLSISGGECMLHPQFNSILEFAAKNDLAISVLTNLTACTDTIVELLKSIGAHVQVSLYSMNPLTHDEITGLKGSFEKTRNWIERLREKQVPCFISCPTMKHNFSDYLDVIAFARSLNMDAQTDFIIMGKTNCDTSNLQCRLDLCETRKIIEDVVYRSLPTNDEYFSSARISRMPSDEEWASERVCGAGSSLICLDAHGFYHPCPGLGGIVLGNCYDHSLEWILSSSPETFRIRSITGKDFPKCLKCPDRNYCTVCICRNYNETGDLFSPARHFCDVAKINHEIVDAFQRQSAGI